MKHGAQASARGTAGPEGSSHRDRLRFAATQRIDIGIIFPPYRHASNKIADPIHEAAMTQAPLKTIRPEDLVALDDYVASHPIRVDTVYAKPAHKDNMFKAAIYRPDARMICHHQLLPVIINAADRLHAETGHYLAFKDCLRPLEAQQKIIESDIVRAHPEWLEEPRLFSPPGKGGHPRGMAIDVLIVDRNGDELEMGTPFDYLTTDKSINPAARDYTDFGRGDAYNEQVAQNRSLLTRVMMQAATDAGRELLPLPQEWWDFRFPNDYAAQYAAVSDADLPPSMRMMA
jgi:D-alanyl-D-alanine dipeptidase